MELKLIRTRFSRGVFSELYHQRKLVFCALEMTSKNGVTLLSLLKNGRYTLRRSNVRGREGELELRAAGGRGLVRVYVPADKPVGLPGCTQPVMLYTGQGREQVSEMAYDNIGRIIGPALSGKTAIGITIETGGTGG